jgi:hypothetical protein
MWFFSFWGLRCNNNNMCWLFFKKIICLSFLLHIFFDSLCTFLKNGWSYLCDRLSRNVFYPWFGISVLEIFRPLLSVISVFYFCQSAKIFSKNYFNIQKYCSLGNVFYPWFGISVSQIFRPLLKSLQFNEFQWFRILFLPKCQNFL